MLDTYGIKSFAWLIQDQQFGATCKRQKKCELCPHPFGKSFDLPPRRQFVVAEEPTCDIGAPIGIERTCKAYGLFNRHVPIEGLVFRNVCDLPPHFAVLFSVGNSSSEHAAVAIAGAHHAEQHLDGSAF